MKKKLHIILIGPQGSGKGTQAELLAKKFNLAHVEIGKILREIARTKTLLGHKVDELINKKGRLVSLQLLFKVVKEKIKSLSKEQGIVFDGTPRRLAEIKPLEKILAKYNRELTHVFYLPISEKETVKRLSKRRICEKCGKIFILGKDVADKIEKCPNCGGKIYQRKDDQPTAIKERLKLYHQKTDPVVKYYRQRRKLIEINGEQSIEKIFKEIMSFIQNYESQTK